MKQGGHQQDMEIIIKTLSEIPAYWDGKRAVLELKEHDHQWKQMEWIGFYFEYLCQKRLMSADFEIPGEKYGKVEFDSFRSINWDMKASAIKSHSHKIILNDTRAIDESIGKLGAHGLILALLDVDYNDVDRNFQKWHTALKGGQSQYEKDRIARKAISRYRKTSARLVQILLLVLNDSNREYLDIHKQGRNSDGSPRNPKYMLDIERADCFDARGMDF